MRAAAVLLLAWALLWLNNPAAGGESDERLPSFTEVGATVAATRFHPSGGSALLFGHLFDGKDITLALVSGPERDVLVATTPAGDFVLWAPSVPREPAKPAGARWRRERALIEEVLDGLDARGPEESPAAVMARISPALMVRYADVVDSLAWTGGSVLFWYPDVVEPCELYIGPATAPTRAREARLTRTAVRSHLLVLAQDIVEPLDAGRLVVITYAGGIRSPEVYVPRDVREEQLVRHEADALRTGASPDTMRCLFKHRGEQIRHPLPPVQ